jgi:hypothetical protein
LNALKVLYNPTTEMKPTIVRTKKKVSAEQILGENRTDAVLSRYLP